MAIKKVLNDQLTLLRTRNYPQQRRPKSVGRSEAILGIGGNVGDTKRRFDRLIHFLDRSVRIEVLETSSILKNPPFGYIDQEEFFNAAIRIKTDLTPKALLGYILRIEKRFGRKRLFKDGPRTLDIDMIFYEDVVMKSDRLTLPHPGWRERESVLIPLLSLCSDRSWVRRTEKTSNILKRDKSRKNRPLRTNACSGALLLNISA